MLESVASEINLVGCRVMAGAINFPMQGLYEAKVSPGTAEEELGPCRKEDGIELLRE